MKRAKKIEAMWCFVMCFALVAAGLFSLWDLREIGPIVPDSQRQIFVGSSHGADLACGDLCWMLLGWLFEHATAAAWGDVKGNTCAQGCGGGGGGGFECAPDDRSCNTMPTN